MAKEGDDDRLVNLGLGLMAAACIAALVGAIASLMVGLAVLHRLPHLVGSLPQAAETLALHPNDPGAMWASADRSRFPSPAWFWAVVLLVVGVAVAGALGLRRLLRDRHEHRGGSRLRPGSAEGLASAAEIRGTLSARSIRRDAQQTRPLADRRTPVEELSIDLGRHVMTGQRLHGSLSATVIATGAQGSGKTSTLFIPELIKYPGAAVVTSTRGDIYECTATLRARSGPVYLFDPTGVLPETAKGRAGWAVQDGCVDPKTAIRRGRDMAVASSAGVGVTNASHWQESCAEVLRYYLHAAALGGYTAAHIDQWASRPGDEEPLLVLKRDDATPGWARKFEALQHLEARERSGVWSSVRRALDFLADPTVLGSCSPGGGLPALDVESLVDERATLYVVGSENDHAVLRPLVVALVDAVTSAARARARRTPGRRPDPPVALFLDECPQIAPLPNLPQLASTARGDGITLYIGCQSPGQLLDLYGEGGRATLMDAATAVLVLPGMTDSRYAEQVSKLCGEREEETLSWTEGRDGHRSQTRAMRTVPVISPADVRSLPAWHAILLYRGMKPIETVLTPWFRRDIAAEIAAGMPAEARRR